MPLRFYVPRPAWLGGWPVLKTASKLPSNIPAEYQDAISKVLPGYEILRNEDMLQDESWLSKFLSPDEIAKRKKRESLGLIVGRFNNDRFLDFAAWVVNRSIKQTRPVMPKSYPWEEHFAARLVVCLGTSTPRTYQCEILPTIFGDFASLPFWADLESPLGIRKPPRLQAAVSDFCLVPLLYEHCSRF